MPEKRTSRQAQEGKAPSTQASEYVREEIEHVREGRHGARSAKQAIAIGLSKARRAGVKLPPPPGKGTPSAGRRKPNPRRARASLKALKRESTAAASHDALSRQARLSAQSRGPANRQKAVEMAVRTKGRAGRHDAAIKAARTRRGA